MRRASTHRGIIEDPAGSNRDNRPNKVDGRFGILKAQRATAAGAQWLDGTPWCGTWARFILAAGGVLHLSSRLASVSLIEDDAKAGRGPFRDWREPSEWRRVLRGDLVVLFGRGVHVEVVRGFRRERGAIYVVTEGGNTSSGNSGSQSNGGGSYRRERPLWQVHGFPRVDYPGGAVRRSVDLLATRAVRLTGTAPAYGVTQRGAGSDDLLFSRISGDLSVGATQLRSAMKAAA